MITAPMTPKCPNCELPLKVEETEAGMFEIWCPHGICTSIVCNDGPPPCKTIEDAILELDELYDAELEANASRSQN
jgi:hypothetical protein